MQQRKRSSVSPSHSHNFWKTPAGLVVYNGAETVAVIAAIATGLALVYMGYGVATGHLARAQAAGSPNYSQFSLGANVFFWGCILVVLAVTTRFYSDEGYMVGLVVLGAVAFLGVPFGVNYMLGEQGAQLSHHAGANVVNDNCRAAGIFIFLIVGIRYLIFTGLHVYKQTSTTGRELPHLDKISNLARQRAKRATSIKPKAFAACWELPYCEDYIRDKCPRFEEKRNCWTRKSGCHCEGSILTRALGLDSMVGGGDAELRALASETLLEMGETQLKCKDCRIFLDHQYRKFRLISPLTPVITGALMFVFSQPIKLAWTAIIEGVAKACNLLAFGEGVQQKTSQLVSDLTSDSMVWTVWIIGGIFLMSAVARLVEWLLLDVKI